MGVGASTPASSPHKIRHGVIARETEDYSFAEPSLAVIPRPGSTPLLALAYQVSSLPHQGSRDQHIAFTSSNDGGVTWQPHRPVQWGLNPLWSPALYWDQAGHRLLLFYSESRKALSPGGDVKCMASGDGGGTWDPPTLVWQHEAQEEVPKVTSGPPVVDAAGLWYLGLHLEPQGAHLAFNNATYSELAAGQEHMPPARPPPAATPASTLAAAAVLVSRDSGVSWSLGALIEHPTTWLMQPALQVLPDGSLLALFRSATGKVFRSLGRREGCEWTPPSPTTLPNPNSKLASLAADDQVLAVHNVGATDRRMLVISLSTSAGHKWEKLVSVDIVPGGVVSSPSIAAWTDDTVKVAYAVLGSGLRLATVQLATQA